MKSEMLTLLENQTKQFFERHWNLEISYPEWDGRWRFGPGEIPNQNKQGCYALLDDADTIIYIGVGAGRVSGKYEGCGIGSRLNQHWRVKNKSKNAPLSEREYEPISKWKERGVSSILTLGFPEGYGYLAYALEAYLISILSPQFNFSRPGDSKALS